MLSEAEVLEFIRRGVWLDDDESALRDAEFSDLPSDNAAMQLTLVDGTRYAITVTRIEEGQ